MCAKITCDLLLALDYMKEVEKLRRTARVTAGCSSRYSNHFELTTYNRQHQRLHNNNSSNQSDSKHTSHIANLSDTPLFNNDDTEQVDIEFLQADTELFNTNDAGEAGTEVPLPPPNTKQVDTAGVGQADSKVPSDTPRFNTCGVRQPDIEVSQPDTELLDDDDAGQADTEVPPPNTENTEQVDTVGATQADSKVRPGTPLFN